MSGEFSAWIVFRMNVFSRGIRTSVWGFVLLLLFAVTARAEPESETMETKAPVNLSSQHLQARFFHSLELIFQERYAEAGDEIHALEDDGRDAGYRNFPEFSVIFFREADEARAKSPELAGFFVRHAMQLSPNDLSIALASFAYADILDKPTIWKHVNSTFWSGMRRPGIVLPSIMNTWILLLSALTLAALIGAFVQLLRHGDLVFRYITRYIPRNWRGILGPFAVLGIMGLPLLWGPGVALGCWAVILGRSVRHCRRLTVLVGLLLVSWSLVMKYAIPLKGMLDSETTRAVDQVNASALVVNAETVLQAALQKDPRNALLTFSLARAYVFEGRYEAAAQYFKLSDTLGEDGEISRASRLNLAVLAIRSEKWDEARSLLEQDEAKNGTRFEVLYNLGLVHLAQLGIDKYRSYYTEAQRFDPEEWQRVDAQQGAQHLPVWSNLHTWGFWRALGTLPAETTAANYPQVVKGSERLAFSLIRGASPLMLGAAGLLLVVLGLIRRSHMGRLWIEQQPELGGLETLPKDSSLLWSLLPGGAFLAGKKPVTGVMFAALVFAVAFVMSGWPLTFLPLSLHPLNFESHAFPSFILAYGIGFLVPVIFSMVGGRRAGAPQS